MQAVSSFLSRSSTRTLIGIWLGWCLSMLLFQAAVTARFDLVRPDRVLFWTATSTSESVRFESAYLSDPFLNRHVSWDSEYYLSIATVGYADPDVRSVEVTDGESFEIRPGVSITVQSTVGESIPLNYAFFPLYPLTMRAVSIPLILFGLSEIATATLAGVMVSMLGSLVAMFALFDITKEELGADGGIRTAFYLIIFPTGMFLAQVYTEGLFVGLAFTALALARRERWLLAALLASAATMTRAVGVALFIPLIIPWIQSGDWMDLDLEWREIYYRGLPWRAIGRTMIHLSPILVFIAWRLSFYGFAFNVVEELFFGRGAFMFGTSVGGWINAFQSIFEDNSQRSVYYLIEFGAIFLGLSACWATHKRYPGLSGYSFLAILIALTSGPPQGMHRYILAAPSVFIFLGQLGRFAWFDRAWTVFSVLLMALLATLFSFDFWVG